MSGPESLRAAGHALLYWQRRQEVNAHNLANVETPGYQGRRVFSQVMEGGLPGLGTIKDPRGGELRETGAPLDLALGSRGFFVVQTGVGEQLVRSGSFSMDGNGQIVDAQGRTLLGETGPIVLPPGPVSIDDRGRITVDGEVIGRLRVVREKTSMDPTAAPGDSGGPSAASRSISIEGPVDPADLESLTEEEVVVRQGYLEGSNVSALDALIEMTTVQRSFEAVQNTVRTIDSVMETVANRLGRVE